MSCHHAELVDAITAGRWVSYADQHLPVPRACQACEAQFGEGAPACYHCRALLLSYRQRHVWAWCGTCSHWVRTAELRAAAA